MHIFFTIDDISGRGGTERVISNLANAFSPQHNITIITYHLRFNQIYVPLPKNAKIINLEDIYGDFEPKGTIGKLKLCHYINKMIRQNGGQSNVLIANCNVFYPFFKRRDTKYIRLEHYRFTFLHKKYIDKKPLFPRVKLFDTLVILSSNELSMWQKMNKNVVVIPNFLPHIPPLEVESSKDLDSNPDSNRDKTPQIVLSAGRLSEEKGFLRLIDIWELVVQNLDSRDKNAWQLHIVGDGILKEQIQAKIIAKGLEGHIMLKPFTTDIDSVYKGASIYAMASHFEGFPMALIEASSHALPCIAFDVATGPSDIIAHNFSGYLVADNDISGFANALISLMQDSAKRRAFGLKAREIVSGKFSKETVMNLWHKLLG